MSINVITVGYSVQICQIKMGVWVTIILHITQLSQPASMTALVGSQCAANIGDQSWNVLILLKLEARRLANTTTVRSRIIFQRLDVKTGLKYWWVMRVQRCQQPGAPAPTLLPTQNGKQRKKKKQEIYWSSSKQLVLAFVWFVDCKFVNFANTSDLQ